MSSPVSNPTLQGPALLEHIEAMMQGADALVLSGGIAHELSNALQAMVLARSTTDGMGFEDPDIRQALDKVVEQVTQAVTTLRELSRPPVNETAPVIVRDLLETVDQWQGYQKLLPRVPVRFDVAPNLPAVRANERRMRHALLALVTNAKEAVAEGRGSIVVTASVAEGGVAIAVADEGAGIAADLAERVFEPFFTTKASPPHRGLGLPVARLAVERSGGSLRLAGGAERGARLVIRLQEWRRGADP